MAYLKSCKVTFYKAKRIQFWLSVYLRSEVVENENWSYITSLSSNRITMVIQHYRSVPKPSELHSCTYIEKKPVPEGTTIRIFDKAGNPRMQRFCLYVECSKSIQKFPKQTARQLTRLWNRVSVEHCLIWPIVAVRCCWIHIHCLPCLLPWSLIVCQSS